MEMHNLLESRLARSLIEASQDSLAIINSDGVIEDLNEALIKCTGIARADLLGTPFKNCFTEPEIASKVCMDVFKLGVVSEYPLTIIDGKFTDVLFNGSVYKDLEGKVLGAVVVARDITLQKQNEKDLIEAKVFAELALEIVEEAKIKAEKATQIAETAMKAKQQFLSNMSHEIRTPMNAIIGFTRVLLKTELNNKQKEYLTAIKMSGDSLIVLINDILDLAKVDAGKMTFEQTPFKLGASIFAMLHLFENKIQEKNLLLIRNYDARIPQVIVGDPVRLHQIIMNLMSNAVKFTGHGSITLNVQLKSETLKSVEIRFSVTDTGIGIDPNKLERIFENFQQASSSTSRIYGGTGLGLAIVKQLVTQQGGTVSVESEVNAGSTFSFTLSFLKTEELVVDPPEVMELSNVIKNIKVLVVEDIPLNQLLMKTLLDDFGFERDVADNGRIALEKLALKSYDVILMDLQMPEMNGFETTEHIRNSLHSNIPIIALTADVTTVDLEKCKSVGMNDYIAKPVDEKILYAKIIALVTKPDLLNDMSKIQTVIEERKSATDLKYLMQKTKSNPELMMEMISLYLKQTPDLVASMKRSLVEKDWITLHASVHKMIPSFAIMGMSQDFENIARKVQEFATTLERVDLIHELVSQLATICDMACKELEVEFQKIKAQQHEGSK